MNDGCHLNDLWSCPDNEEGLQLYHSVLEGLMNHIRLTDSEGMYYLLMKSAKHLKESVFTGYYG
jgi:hypothetical protein